MAQRKLHLQKYDGFERHASWLELFYDLVFVFGVTVLVKDFEAHASMAGMGRFVLMLLPIWWLWIDFSYYFDQFGDEDVATRICLFLSMFLVLHLSVLVVKVETVPKYFAVTYLLQRLIIVFLYLRSYRLIPESRSLTGFYLRSFCITVLLWIASLFFAFKISLILWLAALFIEIINGPLAYVKVKDVPRFQSHMPERFGLFTLIVLGETILSVATAIQDVEWSLRGLAAASLSFLIGVNIWWLYFFKVPHDEITTALKGNKHLLLRSFVYGYGHFFVYTSIAIMGAGIYLALEAIGVLHTSGSGAHVALSGSAFYLASLAAIQWASDSVRTKRWFLTIKFICALLLLSLAIFTELNPMTTLGLVCLLFSCLSVVRWRFMR